MFKKLRSEAMESHKKSFRILTAVITVLFVCSVTVTAFAAANSALSVEIVDGEKSITVSAKATNPYEVVADAGITLYKVGNVKRIEGYKNYVSIDGGMTDNPRYALYQSKYTVVAADKAEENCDFVCDLVGRCCESGDIIQPDITMPKPVRGDIVAVTTTGAYNYSMASNYNRIPRLPVVMLNGNEDYVAVKRETLDDIIRNDV